MNILIGTAAAACLAAIFVYLYFSFFSRGGSVIENAPRTTKAIPEGKRGDAQTCPLCAALLASGETVTSKIFPPSGRADRLLHVSGCKHCLDGERERFCPVCGRPVPAADYLVARIWQYQGKTQVQVRGCVNCLVGKGRARAVRLR
jgi:hypothetical protein